MFGAGADGGSGSRGGVAVGSPLCMHEGLDWGSAGCVLAVAVRVQCSAMGKGSASVRAAAVDEAEP